MSWLVLVRQLMWVGTKNSGRKGVGLLAVTYILVVIHISLRRCLFLLLIRPKSEFL
jgi:hypothetical protein